MALRELTDAEWQHSFVPVLRLAGPGSSTPSGDADPRSREHAVGDVKHVMVRSRDAAARYTILYRSGFDFCVLGICTYMFSSKRQATRTSSLLLTISLY